MNDNLIVSRSVLWNALQALHHSQPSFESLADWHTEATNAVSAALATATQANGLVKAAYYDGYTEREAELRADTATPASASLPPIETDKHMGRHYIPVHPEWEIQTKGNGSTFRIAQRTPDGDRWAVLDERLHAPLEKMARAINAAPVSASDKDAEIAALSDLLAQASAQFCTAIRGAADFALIAAIDAEIAKGEK